MKKFFTLLAGMALMAGTANAADWYISGQFQGWSHCNADYIFKATETAGVFECTFPETKNMNGEFLIVQGTTGSPDWSKKIGTNGTKVKLDTPYTYQASANNFACDGNYDATGVTLNTNNQTITIHGQKAVNSFDVVYMVGQINSGTWNEGITTFPLTKTAEDTYEGKYTLTSATNYIKFKAGNVVMGNGLEYGNDTKVTLGTTYDVVNAGQAYILGPGTYNFKMVVAQEAETAKFTVTQDGPKTFPENMYMIGNVNGWTEQWVADNQVAFVNEGEGIYTAAGVAIAESQASGFGYFSFATGKSENNNWDMLGTRYGATVNDFVVEFENAMTIQAGENAFKVATGTYDFVLNMDKMTLTVTEAVVEDELPETPSDEQLVDAVTLPTGLNATVVESPDFDGVVISGKSTEDTVVLTFTAPEGYDTVYIANLYGDGGVSPLRKLGSGAEWIPASMATAMGAVKTNEVSVAADGEDHEFAVIYGLGDMINADYIWYRANITKDTVSGVEIVAADADATYFNLQGARVANPTNGIYVKVVNGKAVKVVR